MRRRTGSTHQTISLFPFLAVLICMMGALVLLLLGLTSTMRQRLGRPTLLTIRAPQTEPKQDLNAPRPPPPPGPGGFDEEALAQFRKRRDEERQARWQALLGETMSERDAVRAALQAHQEQLRQRQAQLDELGGRLKSQADLSVTEQATTEMLQERQKQSEKEIESLSREIALTERKLEELKQTHSAASNAHAILPYDGRSGTTRRPIYIECTDKGYRFLPEDVFVGPNELRGATPRANALAFGAKALLRYWTLRNVRDPAHHPRPYLLLIVRPGGVFAYDAARQLLSRLESSFGYELVEDEIILQKLPPDPHAVTLLKEAIALASDTSGERSPPTPSDHTSRPLDQEFLGKTPPGVDGGRGRGERGDGAASEVFSEEPHRTIQGNLSPRPNSDSDSGALNAGTPAHPPTAARPRTIRDPLPKASPAKLGGSPGGSVDSQDAPQLSGTELMPGESAPPRRLLPHSTSPGAGTHEGSPGATGTPETSEQWPGSTEREAFGDTSSSREGDLPGTDLGQKEGFLQKERFLAERNGVPGTGSDTKNDDRAKAGSEPPVTAGDNSPGERELEASRSAGRPRGREPESRTHSSGQGPRTNERAPIRKPGEGPDSARGSGEMSLTPPQANRAGGAPRNLIALQRKILIRVEANRVWVGEDEPIEIPVKKNQKADQLIAQVTSAMREVTESWGPPPARFYWNPAVRFEVTREGNPVYERLRGAFERQKVNSSADFVEPTSRQAARRTP